MPIKYSRFSKFVVVSIIVTVLTAIRFDVGFDYANYYSIINTSGGETYRNEPISAFLMDLGHATHFPPLSFILFAILSYSLVTYTFYKNTQYYNFAFFCYLCFFFLDTLGAIRQTLGEAIVFFGFTAIKERKIVRYALICFIGFLAHKSAIFAFPIYFLYNIKSKKILIFTIVIVGIMMSLITQFIANLGLFGSAANRIAEGTSEYTGGNLLQYLYPLLLIYILSISKLRKIGINWNLMLIVMVGILFPFLIGSHYGTRIAIYYNIYICFLLGHILANLSIKTRTFYMSLFGLYFLLYISVGWNKKRPTIAPYQTIFQIENIDNPKFKLAN